MTASQIYYYFKLNPDQRKPGLDPPSGFKDGCYKEK